MKRMSKLRELLETRSGEDQIDFRLPNIFLPPRYQKISKGKDLLLRLDHDFTLHVRWSGLVLTQHHALTIQEAKRLIREVRINRERFSRDLLVFETFIVKNSEKPTEKNRYPLLTPERKVEGAKELEDEKFIAEQIEAEVNLERKVSAEIRIPSTSEETTLGGESPCPKIDY
jgi:hypothetical protein